MMCKRRAATEKAQGPFESVTVGSQRLHAPPQPVGGRSRPINLSTWRANREKGLARRSQGRAVAHESGLQGNAVYATDHDEELPIVQRRYRLVAILEQVTARA